MKKIRRSEFDTTDEQVKVINKLIDCIGAIGERVEALEKKPAKKGK